MSCADDLCASAFIEIPDMYVYIFKKNIIRVCNLSDYPTKVEFRIFCRISSDYEEYARSLSDFNISDLELPVMRHAEGMA